MVGSPNVNDLIKAAFQKLVVVIGDIRGEVSGRPRGANQDVVLILAKSGGDKPERPIPFFNMVIVFDHRQYPLKFAGII